MDILTKFGRDKAGYTFKRVTNQFGDLLLDGRPYVTNKPFRILQYMKKQLLKEGYTSKRVKIKYHQNYIVLINLVYLHC
jgi:hypothetical protein